MIGIRLMNEVEHKTYGPVEGASGEVSIDGGVRCLRVIIFFDYFIRAGSNISGTRSVLLLFYPETTGIYVLLHHSHTHKTSFTLVYNTLQNISRITDIDTSFSTFPYNRNNSAYLT
jgi:hypothetical protein